LDWSEDPEEEGYMEDLGGRWEDNCKIYLKESGWKGLNWIHLAENGIGRELLSGRETITF
jgi:hypothetical protein